ncbi:EcsC family protein [Brevibacillus humidisoli]|uniref:EcsC family protein n=1 Tax=Brevibacillus humidisoli TaxID=2895522 RepID=UPI001E54A919|nr:EcsC family protein [Brevibacillus humidisoli]UFJ40025.1 EcsC family protein [Brevibacillus humidisoli]
METKEQLQQAMAEVETWEQEQKDLWIWDKLARLPFVLLDKVTPAFIQEKLGQAVEELARYVDTGGRYLLHEQEVVKLLSEQSVAAGGQSIRSIEQIAEQPLSLMDAVADQLSSSRTRFATVQGATTGVGGVFTLAIDIPLLLGQSLKVLQEMAVVYGYQPAEQAERVFIVKCLQFTASDLVGKRAILEELGQYGSEAKRNQMIAQLVGWREVALTYRDNFGWKKLLQLIPIAGILFGAYINRKTIEEVAETGRMLYRKRRIAERLLRITGERPTE